MKPFRPNIVLIVLDSVRQDHLSCYGYGRPTTPHIDRLAAEGLRCSRAYSASCWTIPSHASLFTGQFPSQHRVDLDNRFLLPQTQTLAGYLKGLGYATACISSNNFVAGGVKNLNQGFDLTVDVEGDYPAGDSPLSRARRLLQRRWRRLTARDRGARRATRLAREWTARQEGPFFLFMNYMDCHLPYRLKGPERYRYVPAAQRARVDRLPLDPFAIMAGELELPEGGAAGLQALYDGCLHYLDGQVGALAALLKKHGLYENTLFILTSDHGESFGEKGLFDHQYGLYEHLIRVPLVLRLPQGEQPALQGGELVQLTDLYPALVRWLGDGSPAGREALFAGHYREVALAEYLVPNLRAFQRRFPQAPVERFNAALRSIREGDLKLICSRDGDRLLFDLASDPQEAQDLSHARPEQGERLQARLQTLLGPWPETGGGETSLTGLPDELQERLQALGYL